MSTLSPEQIRTHVDRIADQGYTIVADAIETALSLASGLLPVPVTLWAAMSTSGMKTLRLPATPSRLIIASDGDDAGRKAAHALAERANNLGWAVSFLEAPEGQDWNDVLQEGGQK